jgi:murein DD-endopeptidase MepM/ murein hydrolase activator NlpD
VLTRSEHSARVTRFEREDRIVIIRRTTARTLLAVAVTLGVAAALAAASAAKLPPPGVGKPSSRKPFPPPPAPQPTKPTKPTKRIVFPVFGPSTYGNDYGDPRPQGAHQGIDIMATRRTIAVAAEAGKVKFHTTSANAGCMLYLYGASGTTYLYIHLNNDTTSANDNRGKCVAGTAYAPGLKSGAKVGAGDIIGFVGDSGDANGIHPHLHFEVHPKDGTSTNPYPYLRAARKLLYTARTGSRVTLSMSGTLLASEEGTLRLKVDAVRTSAGVRANKVGRTVVLATAPSPLVEGAGGNSLPVARLARALNQPVIVFTEPAGTTLAEKVGSPRALFLARVVLTKG